MPTPTMVAMERAQKITNDLKFEIKRLAQTETEIPKERESAMSKAHPELFNAAAGLMSLTIKF